MGKLLVQLRPQASRSEITGFAKGLDCLPPLTVLPQAPRQVDPGRDLTRAEEVVGCLKSLPPFSAKALIVCLYQTTL